MSKKYDGNLRHNADDGGLLDFARGMKKGGGEGAVRGTWLARRAGRVLRWRGEGDDPSGRHLLVRRQDSCTPLSHRTRFTSPFQY